MTLEFRKIDGREPEGEALHYTACGLDDVYLVNGFTRESVDGEDYVTVEDMDNLWKAIGLHLVINKKVLAPKEIRFLREHMDFTQAELGDRMRVSDQTVARWEKGKTDAFDGPADFAMRVLFLSSACAQPEGAKILDEWMKVIEEIISRDDQQPSPVVFRHSKKKWNQETRELQTA